MVNLGLVKFKNNVYRYLSFTLTWYILKLKEYFTSLLFYEFFELQY